MKWSVTPWWADGVDEEDEPGLPVTVEAPTMIEAENEAEESHPSCEADYWEAEPYEED